MRSAALRGRALGAVLLAVAALAAVPPPARAQESPDEAPRIVVDERFPLRGETIEVEILGADGRPLSGMPLHARYRPNSETAHTADLGTTGADGRLDWTPKDAGVVLLEAGGAEAPVAQARVSVRFGRFPPLGLLVMAVAALLLFGGAALGFSWLLERPRALPADEPPST